MAKNKFKYRCGECGTEQWVSLYQFARASRPRCSSCGSLALDLVSDEAKKRVMLHGAETVMSRDRRHEKKNPGHRIQGAKQ